MTHLTLSEQQDYRAQWIARQQFTEMFNDLCAVFQQATGCTRKEIYRDFIIAGHYEQYGEEQPSDTTKRKITERPMSAREIQQARKGSPQDLMTASEIGTVMFRMDMCAKQLKKGGKCTVKQAEQIHRHVGEMTRLRVFRDMGFFPEGFPVAQWLLGDKDVGGIPPQLTGCRRPAFSSTTVRRKPSRS